MDVLVSHPMSVHKAGMYVAVMVPPLLKSTVPSSSKIKGSFKLCGQVSLVT